MITLLEAMERAADTPMSEWTMAEMLAVEISKRESEIRRLQKELAIAEERCRDTKRMWAIFVENNA